MIQLGRLVALIKVKFGTEEHIISSVGPIGSREKIM